MNCRNMLKSIGKVIAGSMVLSAVPEGSKLNDRTMKVLRKGKWVRDNMESLKPGEKFQLWNPDGKQHVYKGEGIFTAKGRPFKNDKGIWGVVCE